MVRAGRRYSLREQLIDLGPAVLLALAPFVFLPVGGEFENLPKMALLGWGLVALWLLRLSDPTTLNRRGAAALDLAMVALAATLFLSLAWAVNRQAAHVPLLHGLTAVGFYFLLSRAPRPSRTVRALLIGSALAGAGVAILGLLQYHAGFQGIPQSQSPAATFSNRNMASHWIAMALPLAAAAAWTARVLPGRLVGLASVGLAGWFLFVARTRAAWLAVAVALLLVLCLGYVGKVRSVGARAAALLIPVAAISLLALAAPGRTPLDEDPATPAPTRWAKLETGTAELRGIYWRNTVAMIADRFPAGVGPGNFRLAYPLYHRAAVEDWTFDEEHQLVRAHNDHLQFVAETGLAGALVWIALLSLFLATWLTAQRSADGGERVAIVALGLSIVTFLVVAFFSFPTERALPPLLACACLGLLTAWATWTEGEERVADPRWLRPLLYVASGVYLIASAAVLPAAIRGEAARADGLALLEQGRHAEARELLAAVRSGDPEGPLLRARAWSAEGDYAKAVKELEHALELHPSSPNALLNLGWLELQLGRNAEAESYLRRALELMPDSLSAHGNLGLLHFRRGEYARAVDHYSTVLRLARDERRYGEVDRVTEDVLVAHLQLGGCHAATGEVAQAIAHYEAALAINPDVPVQPVLADLRGRLRGSGASAGP